jgi:hypothetical protein
MPKTTFIALAILACTGASAFAAPKDYTFKAVSATLNKGDGVIVSIRLTKKGKTVAGAEVVKSEISMAPDGMADMMSPLTPVPGSEPGVYSFKTDLTMAGRWLLIVSAKIPDEQAPVSGKIEFRAK